MAAALCLTLSLFSALTSCESREQAHSNRAVVIGIDGADWKIIDALAAEGELPNLTLLRSRGVSGPIRTLRDVPLSPVIWTSVVTGKNPSKHGITWFLVDQPDGTRVPVRSYNRKTRAIWNILEENNFSPAVVGWWASYPAEDVGTGVIVSDALGFHGFGRTTREGDDGLKTHPADLFATIDALIPPEQQLSPEFVQRFIHISDDAYRQEKFDPAIFPRRDPENPIHLFQQYAVTAQGYTAVGEKLLASRNHELVLLYFEQIDSLSHLYMKYAPPRLSWIDPQEFERYQDVVFEWYRYQDELLGQLLSHIDLEQTAVFILSDHGFKSGDRRIRSEEVVDIQKAHLDHEPEGIFLAAGPHLRRNAEVIDASVLDLTPTLLYYLGLPVGKDMDGKVLEAIFDPKFKEGNPIQYVSTYEEPQLENQSGRTRVDEPPHSQNESEIESQLRTLGYLGEATKAEPDEESSPEIHNNLGRIHLGDGNPEQAIQEFEKALGLDPRNADALLNMAAIHYKEGQTHKAKHFVQLAMAANPNSIGALAQLAEIQRDQGNLNESIRLYTEALQIDDSQPFVWLGLGDALQRAGRYEPAIQSFRTVLELNPDSFNARYNLGVTYSNMGLEKEAMTIYREALALAPKHPDAPSAQNNLGAMHLKQGETETALIHFEAALETATTNLESRYNAAIIYLEMGRTEEAIVLLQEAAELEPNHGQVNLRLGFAYLDAGQTENAFRTLLMIQRLEPENWSATIGLAVLHARAREIDPARGLVTRAIAQGGEEARSLAGRFPVLSGLMPVQKVP